MSEPMLPVAVSVTVVGPEGSAYLPVTLLGEMAGQGQVSVHNPHPYEVEVSISVFTRRIYPPPPPVTRDPPEWDGVSFPQLLRAGCAPRTDGYANARAYLDWSGLAVVCAHAAAL